MKLLSSLTESTMVLNSRVMSRIIESGELFLDIFKPLFYELGTFLTHYINTRENSIWLKFFCKKYATILKALVFRL
jgi:hypothetical protein